MIVCVCVLCGKNGNCRKCSSFNSFQMIWSSRTICRRIFASHEWQTEKASESGKKWYKFPFVEHHWNEFYEIENASNDCALIIAISDIIFRALNWFIYWALQIILGNIPDIPFVSCYYYYGTDLVFRIIFNRVYCIT